MECSDSTSQPSSLQQPNAPVQPQYERGLLASGTIIRFALGILVGA
jgi:hypothetical protein